MNSQDLAPYFNYHTSLSENCFMRGDIEYYLLNSYALSFSCHTSPCFRVYEDENVPIFWDISDLFDIESEESRWLTVNCFPYRLHKDEVTQELLEGTLIAMKAEFITMLGEHVNECQNILLEEMIEL